MPHLNRTCTVRAGRHQRGDGRLPARVLPGRARRVVALTAEGYVGRRHLAEHDGDRPDAPRQRPGPGADRHQQPGQRLRLGLPGQRHDRAGDPTTAINAFGLRPGSWTRPPREPSQVLGVHRRERGGQSPWAPFHVEHGVDPETSTVTAMTHALGGPHRGAAHHRSRAAGPRPRRHDRADRRAHPRDDQRLHRARARARRAVRPRGLDQGRPAPVRLRARRRTRASGWSRSARTRSRGKTRWRLPSAHPDAVPDSDPDADVVRCSAPRRRSRSSSRALTTPGVSAVIETFGPRGGPPAIAPVESAS